jgi:hypothetical protein
MMIGIFDPARFPSGGGRLVERLRIAESAG